MATYEQWLDAYETAYFGGSQPTGACPNCGYHKLHLVYTGHLERAIGYAAFWCGHCLQGIHISRAPIPAGAIARDIAVPPDEREPAVPDYEVITAGCRP